MYDTIHPDFVTFGLHLKNSSLKNLVLTKKVDRSACIFPRCPYLCIVFFIVLDLRLTRLGYSGIPFLCLYVRSVLSEERITMAE